MLNSVPGRGGSYKSVRGGRAHRGRVPGFLHFPEKPPDIGLKVLGEGAAPAPQIRGRASSVHGAGPEGSPGAGGCPGRAGKGREGSRVLPNAATDVLHEGPEAQGGGLGTRRLAAGEGLPGGRHRLGEHANSSSCLAPSGLRFCGDPLLFSGHVPRPMLRRLVSALRRTLPGRRHASVLSVNLSFHPRFVACGAASSPALL